MCRCQPPVLRPNLRLCHCNRDSICKLRQQNWVKEPQTASFESRSRQFQLGNNCNDLVVYLVAFLIQGAVLDTVEDEEQLFKKNLSCHLGTGGGPIRTVVGVFQAMSSILPMDDALATFKNVHLAAI